MKFFKKNRVLQSLGHNAFPKIVCLFLAIASWFIVMENKNPVLETIYRDIPVELIGLEQVENRGLLIESINGDSVDVTVSGRWRDIIKMNGSSIRLSVSLDSIVGKGTANMLIDHRISSAPGVGILSLSKDSISFEVDAIETIKKPINLVLKGELPEELELGNIVFNDEEIEVTGPSLLLKEIVYLKGELDISSIASTTTEHINLIPVDIDENVVEEVELEVSNLPVSVPVIGEKTVPLEIVTEGEIRTNYRLTEKTSNLAEVTLKGDTSLLSGISLVRTKPISIKNAYKSFESMLEADLPKDLVVVDAEPLTAKFTIAALDNKRFNFEGKDVVLTGTNESYNYIIDPELILSLEVKDVRENIKNIEEKSITLETDVKGLTPGDYTLQISVKGIAESSHYDVSELPINIVPKGN